MITRTFKTKTLLACGVIAGPLFVIAFLVEGFTRVHYDPLRHPVSSLAIGNSGWTQSANFLVAGLLMLTFAVGLRRALRPPRGPTWDRSWSEHARSGCSAQASSSPIQ